MKDNTTDTIKINNSAMKVRSPYVIGITGLAGAGKSTLAGMLSKQLRLPILSFGTPIKRMLSVIGITKELSKPEVFRHAAQTLGTDWGRDMIGRDMWLENLKKRAANLATGYIIDDVRFPNEAEFVREFGTLITIYRPRLNELALELYSHESERGLDSAPVDKQVINNGNVFKLAESAMELASQLAIELDKARGQ